MKRESLVGAAIVLIVIAVALTTAVLPGVFSDPTDARDRPGRVDIREVSIAPGSVTGSSATLNVTTYLRHHGGQSTNISLRIRAIDLDSGMVETIRTTPVEPISGDREVTVPTTITVERSGGYRIEALLYVNDARHSQAAKRVDGVGSLTPAYADTSVAFHRFAGTTGDALPAVQYSIERAAANHTTLAVSAYLTNQGDDPSDDLRIQFILRQAESNIVAARESVHVGAIQPGRTVTPGTSVTVPANYNYYLDAVLWKDGVIVGSARSAANLHPTEQVSVNTSIRTVGLVVSDFEEQPKPRPTPGRTPVQQTQAPGQPGFTVIGLFAAILVIAVLTWRRIHE